jgi:hypothetical protein
MSELTEAQPSTFIPTEVLNPLVDEITAQLREPNRRLIRRIVIVVGVERAQALLHQTLAIEAAGGQQTRDGTRRKTPGGVFISLARAQAVSPQERQKLLDYSKPKPVQPAPPMVDTPVLTPLTWAEATQVLAQALQAPGEAKTVKITLTGRPSQFAQQPNCVVIALQDKAPPALPKGLPTPPPQSAMPWVVFIANPQWAKVKEALKIDAEDQLLLEGYPLLDPKSKSKVVLVTSCKNLLQERAQRAAKTRRNE